MADLGTLATPVAGRSRRRPSRARVGRLLWFALWPAGLLWGLGAVMTFARYGDKSSAQLASDLLAGWAFIATGLIAWARLPDRRIGPIATAVGFSWFVGTWAFSASPLVHYLGWAFQGWYDPLIAWLAMAYPSGRVTERSGRVVLAAWFATMALWTAARLLLDIPLAWYPCPNCDGSVDAWVTTQEQLGSIAVVVGLVSAACALATVVVLVNRLRIATPLGRRRLAPVALATVLIALGLAATNVDRVTSGAIPTALATPLINALAVLVASAILAGLLNDRATRSAVADVVGVLDVAEANLPSEGVAGQTLERALGTALGDASLRVLRWDPLASCYRDGSGARVERPTETDRVSVMALGDGDPPEAVLIHDPALRDDPGLASAVGAAVRLHVENERLQATVRGQLDDVRASRARLVVAADTERRRLERDLHDGAQQRLVSLALDIRRARAHLAGGAVPDVETALEDAAGDVQLAIDELRELARGIHPSALAEAGLGAALDGLAGRSRLPVEVTDELGGARFAPTIEATAYFMVAEALTNAQKASRATVVRVRAAVDEGRLVVEVTDDGVGGADPERGSGLHGLEDRVTAVGGTLMIASPAGAGTRLVARIPVDG